MFYILGEAKKELVYLLYQKLKAVSVALIRVSLQYIVDVKTFLSFDYVELLFKSLKVSLNYDSNLSDSKVSLPLKVRAIVEQEEGTSKYIGNYLREAF